MAGLRRVNHYSHGEMLCIFWLQMMMRVRPWALALAQAMRRFGKVSVPALDRDWSGGGHVKTLKRPLRVCTVKLADDSTALTSDGAPSDCVALALLGFLPD
jgi:5'-nucleotidase